MLNYCFISGVLLLLVIDFLSGANVIVTKNNNNNNNEDGAATCQQISVPMCRNMPYNLTRMPNQFNHETQQDAALEVHQFWALVEINCSKDLRFFLCSMYTPICIANYAQPVRACRSVCERARGGCEKFMKKFGFEWPVHMNCNLFPEYGSTKEVCMDPMDAELDEQHVVIMPNEILPAQVPVADDTKNLCLNPLIKITNEKDTRYNKISTGNVLNCARPCFDKHFTQSEYKFSFYWVLFWSILCFLSSSSTALTFLIDKSRFKYPEKPIIYLSICYLFISLGFLLKYMIGHERVACELDGSIKNIMSSSRNTTGTSAILCTIIFVLIYYFTMASSVWWVIISLTWFLAAGLKWGIESISKLSYYFHIVAWILPMIKTIIVLTVGYVDADSLTGICYVGNTSLKTLNMFVIIPMFIYLAFGVTFLLLGFMSLFHLRNLIKKQQGQAKTTKLETLMIRIGIFSILYTIPATCLISCYFYEQYYRIEWEQNFVCARQFAEGGNNISVECLNTRRPEFSVFMLKYFSILIIGVTSGFWTWTLKTFISWRDFIKSCCCCCKTKMLYRKGTQKDSVIYFHASNENTTDNNNNNSQEQQEPSHNPFLFRMNDKHQQQDLEANYCNIGGNSSTFDSEPTTFNDDYKRNMRVNCVAIKNAKLIQTSSISSDSTISTSQTNSYSLISNQIQQYPSAAGVVDQQKRIIKYTLASPSFIRK